MKLIISFVFETIIKKIITDNLPEFSLKSFFKKELIIKNTNELFFSKCLLLQPISRLYLLPNFDSHEEILKTSYYEVIIKLLNDFDIHDKFNYHKSNFRINAPLSNKSELIGYLHKESEKINEDKNPYILGLRSIYVILDDNLDKINAAYISNINYKLQPFFNSYEHKELLVNGLKLIDS